MTTSLAGTPMTPTKILFVCAGNICRSPMAEALAARMLRPSVVTASAGIVAAEGDAAYDEAVEVMAQLGIDLSGHRSRHLSSVNVEDFDVVVAMAPEIADAIMSRYPEAPIIEWDVSDPMGCGSQPFERCRDEIAALIEMWSGVFLEGSLRPDESTYTRS